MKIKKYIKIKSNKYKIVLENDEEIILYEDVILKFELLLKKEIKDLESILEYNNKYSLYDKALSYISKKQRSVLEIKNYLNKYTSNTKDINNIINKLYENNLLNDKLYIKSYINDKIYLSLDGPKKIKNNLLNLGYSDLDIDDELIIFNQELIKERINKYLSKQLKVNKKSIYIFKNKMLINLLNLGYEREDILNCLNKITFDEKDLKQQEEIKLRKKYQNKYSAYQLEQIIKKKLYEKGYR